MNEQVQDTTTTEQKPNDKEYNFRQQEAKYERMLAQERAARAEMEKEFQRLQESSKNKFPEDDTDDEPYVDHKRLEKKLTSFEKKLEEKIERKAEEKARNLLESEKRDSWIRSNSDFYDVLKHAEKLAQQNPELAETILQMPEGFERQKLVYSNIKALGLHKAESKQPSIQEKIDANRRSPYYQPTGVASPPYAAAGDFTPAGQKNAYAKMQELKARLRA